MVALSIATNPTHELVEVTTPLRSGNAANLETLDTKFCELRKDDTFL